MVVQAHLDVGVPSYQPRADGVIPVHPLVFADRTEGGVPVPQGVGITEVG